VIPAWAADLPQPGSYSAQEPESPAPRIVWPGDTLRDFMLFDRHELFADRDGCPDRNIREFSRPISLAASYRQTTTGDLGALICRR
jgi:hypothetical protein